MHYYNEQDVKNWKNLYENIGTFKGVREFIKKQGNSPPKIDTMIRHLKKLLGDNYKKWLKEN